MTLVAVVMAAAAGALLFQIAGDTTMRPGARSVGGSSPTSGIGRVSWGRRAVWPSAIAGTWLVLSVRGPAVALVFIGLAATWAGGRLVANARSRKSAQQREQRVLEACEVLVGELRAGRAPVTALERGARTWVELAPVATAARLGADVPTAFREVGALPGARGLRHIAGAWQVSQGSGAGLAAALGQVAATTREAQSTRQLVASELASAQSTARLVAILPVVALVMGSGIGGDPWGFLLTTSGGLCCLAAGLTLAFAGLAWIDHIARSVVEA